MAVEIAQNAFAVMPTLSGHAQSQRDSALHFTRSHEKHPPSTDIVVRAQSHPGCESRSTAEFGKSVPTSPNNVWRHPRADTWNL
jgi:hypothetical protein